MARIMLVLLFLCGLATCEGFGPPGMGAVDAPPAFGPPPAMPASDINSGMPPVPDQANSDTFSAVSSGPPMGAGVGSSPGSDFPSDFSADMHAGPSGGDVQMDSVNAVPPTSASEAPTAMGGSSSVMGAPSGLELPSASGPPGAAQSMPDSFSGPPGLGGGDLSTMEGPPFDMVASAFDPNGATIKKALLINSVDANNMVNPEKGAAGLDTGFMYQNQAMGVDATNHAGAFDAAPSIQDALTGPAGTHNQDWADGTNMPQNTWNLDSAPFTNMYSDMHDSFGSPQGGMPTFGAGDMMALPELPGLPPMEPMPPPPPEPEEPPPLPEELEPPGGDITKCQGGHITDLSQYSDCTVISGFLSLDEVQTDGFPVLNLDALKGIQSIELDPSFINEGTAVSITNNPQLQNVDGLFSLQGDLPGALVMENNPKLIDISGFAMVSGIDQTVNGDSLVLGDMQSLTSVDGLHGLSGNLPGAVVMHNLPSLSSTAGLGQVTGVGADKNGVGVQVENTGLTDVSGFSSLTSIGGAVSVSNNAHLTNIDGFGSVASVGKSGGGVSLHVLENEALSNVDGFKSVVGQVPGSVQIAGNPQLSDVNGLTGITTVGQDVNQTSVMLLDNQHLANVDGFGQVTAMEGGVRIEGNALLENTDGFQNSRILGADKVGVSVGVVSNENLRSIDGLGALTNVPGAVQMHDNPNLQSVGMTNLQQIGADVSGVSLELSQLSGVTNLDGLGNLQQAAGGIAISNMQNLNSTQAMEKLSTVGRAHETGRSVEIVQNTGLTDVSLPSLNNVPGGVLVQGNADLATVNIPATNLGMDTQGRSLEVLDNSALTGLGLGNLEIAQGGIVVHHNDALQNMNGLDSLQTVGQDTSQKSLQVSNNNAMTDLTGLGNLAAVPGGIAIQENSHLQSLHGLDSLSQVGADSNGKSIEVVGNDAMTSMDGLQGVNNLPGALSVVNNANLHDLSGIDNVASIGQDTAGRSVEIVNNTNMESLHGIENVAGALPGGVEIAGNAALSSTAAMAGVTSIGAAKDGVSVILSGNPALSDVEGFATVESAAGSVEITNNDALKNVDGFSGLTTVGADNKGVSVAIDGNSALTSTEGMKSVSGDIPGSVLVRRNPSLELLYGFDSANSIGKDAAGNSFEATENDMLAKINALRKCTSFEGALVLQKNPILKSLEGLQAITQIKGRNLLGDSLLVFANKELESLKDLSSLHGHLSGAISIADNSKLSSCDGLGGITGIDNANTYGNAIEVIKNENMNNVDCFQNVTGTLPGALSVEGNTQLGNVDGFHGITGIAGSNNAGESLIVFNNENLQNVDGFSGLGGELEGGVVVSGNSNLESISGLEGDSPITSSGKVVIQGVKCLSDDEVDYFQKLCADESKCHSDIQNVAKCAGPSSAQVLVGRGKGRVCGGSTGSDGWTSWSLYGNTGLYIDVDTSKCAFTLTPNYVASIGGDSGHWQLIGVNSIYKPTSRGFRVYLWHPSLKGSFMEFFAQRYKWSINWMADTGRTGGQTRAGKSGWKQFAKDTLYLDVDTTLCQYTSDPAYVTSMHGASDHWRSTGVHSIYNPTKSGFRVYVMHASGSIAASDAERHEWSLSWIGSESSTKAGHSSTNWKVFCASKDMDCGSVAHFYSIYVDVAVTGKYDHTPTYVTAVGGTAHHLVVTGAGSIYRAAKDGFRVYLDKAPSPQVAKMANWQVNWLAYEEGRDCTQSPWGAWEDCTATCGGGTSSRRRETITIENEYGSCPETVQSGACNTMPCPQDCEMSEFGVWEDCSVTCGVGVQLRKRSVVVPAAHGGKKCPLLQDSKSCEGEPCRMDCEFTDWTPFDECTRSCGFGYQSRTRTITSQAAHGGKACPVTVEQQPCNFHPCPIDCAVSEWNEPSPCSVSCTAESHHYGTQERTRYIMIPAFFGGKQCPATKELLKCNPGACPKHCDVSPWGPYGQCSKSCQTCDRWGDCDGGGEHTRTRSIIANATDDGMECPVLEEKGRCNTHPCPRDCAVDDWEAWKPCSRTCGTGYQTRERHIKAGGAPIGGGLPCPQLSEFRGCNIEHCPIDCKVTDYRAFGACTVSCGSGTKERRRSISVSAAFDGQACPPLVESTSCHKQPCPEDCKVTDFSDWNGCSTTCGAGSQTRTRRILRQPRHGGVACPRLLQHQGCNEGQCPVHCEVWNWSPWSSCSKTCGTSLEIRSRSVKKHAMHGGYACPALREERTCNTRDCPGDCTVSTWGAWSECSQTCGTGEQTRERMVVKDWKHGGKACPNLEQWRKCNSQHCPVDCKVSGYGPWSSCSKTCGTGTHSRGRSVLRSHLHGGKSCPDLVLEESCHIRSCPVDCVVGPWKEWESCTRTCGTGFQERHREVITKTEHGGQSCRHVYEHRVCNGQSCPIDCLVSEWDLWSRCSVTCGSGFQTHRRSVMRNRAFGGMECAALDERRDCHNDACAVDCVVTKWSDWDSCSKTCGRGTQSRRRYPSIPPVNGGADCPSLTETFHCTQGPCPVGCRVTEWTQWTRCSHTCGGGKQYRHRRILAHAKHGGYTCPDLDQMKGCNSDRCPVDCVVTGWGNWNSCTKSCNTGSQSRTRGVVITALYGGKACPSLKVERRCNVHTCPIDCEVTEFSPKHFYKDVQLGWTACSRSCGGGHMMRSRSIKVEHAFGGKPCPALEHTLECNYHPCPIDCLVSQWNDWGDCSQSCGGGSRTRSRSAYQSAAYGGTACPVQRQTQECNNQLCPVDCVLSKWSAWSGCSASCGMGTHGRVRLILTAPANGGKRCAIRQETNDCVEYSPCPMHCEVTPYSTWSTCTKTCGSGTQTRTRTIASHAAFGGYTCPNLVDVQKCRRQPCPVDCVVSSYSEWSDCSHSCGVGYRSRSRNATTPSMWGGKSCPVMQEVEMCSYSHCPIDCEVASWGDWTMCSHTCGVGSKSRYRNILRASAYGGHSCPAVAATDHCNQHQCPTDCKLTPYGDWSACTVSCGAGSRTRSRSVERNPIHGGRACGTLTETSDCGTGLCPVDCEFAAFSDWTECAFCGVGSQTRTRQIGVHAANGGKQCAGDSMEVQSCSLGPCHQHCTVSKWSTWSSCDASCGGGFMRRSRSVVKQQTWGGDACPHMTEVESCNSDACPQDCVVEWGQWTQCTRTCGTGYKIRTATITTRPAAGGSACPNIEQQLRCNTHNCPIDCQVSTWDHGSINPWENQLMESVITTTELGAIVRELGGLTASDSELQNMIDRVDEAANPSNPPHTGFVSFSRFLSLVRTMHADATQEDLLGQAFQAFGGDEIRRVFDAFDKDADGGISAADLGWSTCSRSCGTGKSKRIRNEQLGAEYGGFPCPALEQERNCYNQPCPVDCEVTAFREWSECSATCGGGERFRSRDVIRQASYGGRVCPSKTERSACSEQRCPVDCVLTDFGDWGVCSRSCGSGFQIKSRSINIAPKYGGVTCGALHKSKYCNTHLCPTDCETSTWSEWTECTATCGDGSTIRHRSINRRESAGGNSCPSLTEESVCRMGECPIHCEVSTWNFWSECTVSCGDGVRSRTRHILNHASFGGYVCPSLNDTRSCGASRCPVDCAYTWTAWTRCDRTCGGGEQTRRRHITSRPGYGGATCPPPQESRGCGPLNCPQDCVVGSFGNWTGCSKSCGSGSRTRTRSVERGAVDGGLACPDLLETTICNTAACPVDCEMSSWAPWGICETSCGEGSLTKSRSINVQAMYGGKPCGVSSQVHSCGNPPCPSDCQMSTWSEWGHCSTTCGDGITERTRTVQKLPMYGGHVCPPTKDREDCQDNTPCPVHCTVTDWGAWTECTHTCGSGSSRRTRSVVQHAQFGATCPNLLETRDCKTQACPVDCVVSEFTAWEDCTATCGGGERRRTRSINVAAAYGGVACPNLEEKKPCNTHSCTLTSVSTLEFTINFPIATRFDAAQFLASLAEMFGLGTENLQIETHASLGCSYSGDVSASAVDNGLFSLFFPSERRLMEQNTDALAHALAANENNCPRGGCVETFSIAKNIETAFEVEFDLKMDFSIDTEGMVKTELASMFNVEQHNIDVIVGSAGATTDVSVKITGDGDIQFKTAAEIAAGLPGANAQVQGAIKVSSQTNVKDAQVVPSVAEMNSKIPGASFTQPTLSAVVTVTVTDDASKLQSLKDDHLGDLEEFGDNLMAKTGVVCYSIVFEDQEEPCPKPEVSNVSEVVTELSSDCLVSQWSTYSLCTKTCGGGSHTRTRTITKAAEAGGKPCPYLLAHKICNYDPCPIDCIVSVWSPWANCPVTCGETGMQSRTRVRSTDPRYGGVDCPAMSENRPCNRISCPVACQMSGWSAWTSCSASCGADGQKTATRTVNTPPQFGGAPCPTNMRKTESCNEGACPVHCEMSQWSAWASGRQECSRDCGSGSQTRSRHVVTHPASGGYSCPTNVHEEQSCNTDPCPIDCVLSEPSRWSTCSATCGRGRQMRTRDLNCPRCHPAQYGGRPCVNAIEYQVCADFACPGDCHLSEWGEWSACTQTCHSGSQKRIRTVVTEPSFGGEPCEHLGEQQSCNEQACPEDCEVSEYGQWSTCSVTCGTGQTLRERVITRAPANGGMSCPQLVDRLDCNTQNCPVNCQVGEFEDWSACTVTCGSGSMSRSRNINVPSAYGGTPCPAIAETKFCNLPPCAIDCEVTAWDAWHSVVCSATCGGGHQTRERSIATNPEYGGRSCGSLTDTRECNMQLCPVDCELTPWTDWTECTLSCGEGSQTRTRTVVTPPSSGGKACGARHYEQTCVHYLPCPVHCEVSEFTPWMHEGEAGGCSHTCGTGSQSRTRTITAHAQFGGYTCPDLVQTQNCNTHCCPVDCELGDWSPWSECTASCGTGYNMRSRAVTTNTTCGGRVCGALDGTKVCNDFPCPKNCEMSEWGLWSACSRSCGGGSKTRSRSIQSDVGFGGTPCPAATMTKECNTDCCPVDAMVSTYGPYSRCSRSCGGGSMTRTRTITRQASCGGRSETILSQSATCQTDNCPVDCRVSTWSRWGTCSRPCGGGTQQRTRSVTRADAYGGRSCLLPDFKLKDVLKCNKQCCRVDCVMNPWDILDQDSGRVWGRCTRTCGGGTQTRTRTIHTPADCGGDRCGATGESQSCNEQACPEDCEVSEWGAWSECRTSRGGLHSCGRGGSQTRSKTVLKDAKFGGRACPAGMAELRDCNSHACPVDCEMSDWTDFSDCSVTCSLGSKTRTRRISVRPRNGGEACGETSLVDSCDEGPCTVHCEVSEFPRRWSRCSRSCGTGSKSRTRTIVTEAAHGGDECPPLIETEECNTQHCPQDCALGPWNYESWDDAPCSRTCGGGTQERSRQAVVNPRWGGKQCGAQWMTRECNLQPCPVDCMAGNWTEFSVCTKSCGGGVRTRTRQVTGERYGGRPCRDARTEDIQDCNTNRCPVDCVVSGWGSWTDCDRTCQDETGTGSQTATRTITRDMAYGGQACPALEKSQECYTQPCPIDCVLTNWTEWSECTKTCRPEGGRAGTTSRSRHIIIDGQHGGVECRVYSLFTSANCNEQPCKVDCVVSDWSGWGDCSATCGTATATRTRTITTDVSHGGQECPDLTETSSEPCSHNTACPTHCEVGPFSEWSSCTTTCGGGTMRRTRNITVAAADGGIACPPTLEELACSTDACPEPIHCEVTDWTEWTTCTKTCGSGVSQRSRTITVQPRHNGDDCPALEESKDCNTCACAIDCVEDEWAAWSTCTHSCGTLGMQTRQRSIITWPSEATACAAAGRACGGRNEHRACNQFECPVDCVVGEFSDWGSCMKNGAPHSCSDEGDTGLETRVRELLVDADHGGQACPALIESRSCWGGPCPVHCETSAYDTVPSTGTIWTACTKSCTPEGGESGTHRRTRHITQHAAHGGFICPQGCDLVTGACEETHQCNEHYCPVDCEVGSWGAWYAAAVSENGGRNLKRTRDITQPAKHGGKDCPSQEELKIFHHDLCDKDQTGDWSACSKTCGTDGYRKRFHELIKCGGSHKAAVRMHVKFTHTEQCNIKQCETEEEAAQDHQPVFAPEINSSLADEMELVESVGRWVPVTQEDIRNFDLTEQPAMMKFQKSA